MKKLLVVLCAILLATSIFMSCSKEQATGGSASNSGKIELTFWHYFTPPTGPVFEEFIERYNNSQDKIVVIPEFVPPAELLKQYTIGAISGELPDFGMIDNPDHASFSAMGVFEDLTDYYNNWDEANFFDGPINSCMYNGRIYGLPQASNCLALFYDEDMLEAAGVEVPTTWSELEAACAEIVKQGVYGFAMCAIGAEEGTFQFVPFLESAGSFDDLDSPGSIEAMEFLGSLIEKGYMSREVINWVQNDVEKQFSAGTVAMMVNGPWNVPSVRANAPDKNWNVAYIPRANNGEHASVLGGENFVICEGADVDAAWDFLTWFCGKEISEEYNKTVGKFSPRSDVDGAAMYADDEVLTVFATLMDSAQPRGPHPRWPEISSAVYTAMQEVFSGQKAADIAMQDAQIKVDRILFE
ncbi:MAG: ABC transporter substrate-binding protein [Spirochaetales bacterium]